MLAVKVWSLETNVWWCGSSDSPDTRPVFRRFPTNWARDQRGLRSTRQIHHHGGAGEAFIQKETSDLKALLFQAFPQVIQQADHVHLGQDKAQGQRHPQPVQHDIGRGNPIEARRAISHFVLHALPLALGLFAMVRAVMKIDCHVASLPLDTKRGADCVSHPLYWSKISCALVNLVSECLGHADQKPRPCLVGWPSWLRLPEAS
jgi:hypothetical protein